MVANRVFNVRWVSGPTANAVKFDAKPDRSVRYSGESVEVHRTVAKAAAPAHRRRKRVRK